MENVKSKTQFYMRTNRQLLVQQAPCSAEAVYWNVGVWKTGFSRMIQEMCPQPTPVVRLTQVKL